MFFFNDTATTEIYPLSLHDALPIFQGGAVVATNGALLIVSSGTLNGVTVNGTLDVGRSVNGASLVVTNGLVLNGTARSEKHTSEFQSPVHLVCRLLLGETKSGLCST